nr:head-tail connector protein [uncultured Brevundimonas sp.]
MLKVVVEPSALKELVTLDEAKAHLRVDHDDEDVLIQTYLDGAVQACLTYCDLKLVPIGAEPSFKNAALLSLADLYAYRETGQVGSASSRVNVATSVETLLRPFRIIRI